MPLRVGLNGGLDRASRAESAILQGMNARVDHLLHALLELPAEERNALAAALVDGLADTPEATISDAWRLELVARRDALRAGLIATEDWATVRAKMEAL